jgi:hypothetical protein
MDAWIALSNICSKANLCGKDKLWDRQWALENHIDVFHLLIARFLRIACVSNESVGMILEYCFKPQVITGIQTTARK